MVIIGMTGPIGHGKSTFAKAIKELVPSTVHLESSMVIAEIANAMHGALSVPPDPYGVDSLNNWLRTLPAILLEHMHIHTTIEALMLDQASIEQHPVEYQKLILHVENLQRDKSLMRQEITRDNKETYRPFLQWLGGYLVTHIDKNIWYNEIVKRIHAARDKGAELCIIGGLRFPSDADAIRNAGGVIIKVYRPGHLQNDMLDPTERERDNIIPDSTIMSNGTVDDVTTCAKQVLDDIKNQKLEKLYQTVRAS